jgi:hypothetical protein
VGTRALAGGGVSKTRPGLARTSRGPNAAPELFDGYCGTEASGYLATPEKALFDTVYVRAARGARPFFPELSTPENFDEIQLEGWAHRLPTPRLQTLVSRGLEEALGQSSRVSSG